MGDQRRFEDDGCQWDVATRSNAATQQNNANRIWSIADLLRGPYELHQLGGLDEETKSGDPPAAAEFLAKASGQSFYNNSAFTLQSLMGDPASIKANLIDYLHGFSENARDLFERFEFEK